MGERVWNVLTKDGVDLGTFRSRGDVYALARRIPGVIIFSVQRYAFVEASDAMPPETETETEANRAVTALMNEREK